MATFSLGHRGNNASGTIVLTGSGSVQPYENRWALYKADLSDTGRITIYNKVASGNSFIGTADIYSNTTTDPTYAQWDRAFGIIFYASTGTVPPSQYAADHTWPSGQETTLPGYHPEPTTYDYYWQYQYYTKSTSRIIGTSSVYSKTGVSSSAGYNVAVSGIGPYSNTTKTNTYTQGRYCGYANGFFTIYTTSSQGSPAICYVQVDIDTFTWHGSDTTDNNLIKPLASIRTGLTATAWNRFNDIMLLVGNASQAGVETHKTTTGATVSADLLKDVLTELQKIESQQHIGITIVDPQTIVKNKTRVLASYFNGDNSIKDNLNKLADSVNS